jgi:co-chaperonin GroES (HSP10)
MPRSVISDTSIEIPIDELRPIADHVLIEVIERRVSASGLILPKAETTECLYGKVLAVGEGETNPATGTVHPIGVKPGDYIMSVQYMGEKVEAIGKKYRLLREHGIWAKVDLKFKAEWDWSIERLEPYRDHVLLKMAAEEKSLKGHIFLPANPQAQYRVAEIVSVGPGRRMPKAEKVTPIQGVEKGDKVICLRYAGCVVRMGNVEYRLANEEDLEAVMPPDGEVDVLMRADAMPKPVDDYDVIPDSHLEELNKKTVIDSGGKL